MKDCMMILGLMSGTSLDGVDLALCRVGDSHAEIVAATTVPYADQWRSRLASLENASALEYAKANVELGHYFGHIISDVLADKNVHTDAVASHGHTIFHQPQNGAAAEGNSLGFGLTTQIGDLDAIAHELDPGRLTTCATDQESITIHYNLPHPVNRYRYVTKAKRC